MSRLSAPDGVISILGNHDYGDYSEWPSAQAKADNLTRMHALQADMGWSLLLNSSEILKRGGDSIAVVGVENWETLHLVYTAISEKHIRLSAIRYSRYCLHTIRHIGSRKSPRAILLRFPCRYPVIPMPCRLRLADGRPPNIAIRHGVVCIPIPTEAICSM